MMNNALRQTVRAAGQRRFQSGTSTTFLHKHKEWTVKKAWLSDPSAYPLIAIMGGAAALVLGVGGSCLMYSPDVQISPSKRGSEIRTWSF